MVVSAGRDPQDPDDQTFETIESGDTISFQAALVIGRGFEGMVDNAIQAQLTYDGAFLDCDQDASTGVAGRETRVCPAQDLGETFCLNACDSLCDCVLLPHCRVTIQNRCEFINADCALELESGEPTGVDGKECLIHWLIGTAPPPPNMRLVAREGRVDLLWDNRSETTPDLRLAEIDFESYRIWRADNWTRPLGTDVNTGPGGDLWALLAEYDLPSNHIGSDTGFEGIRYRPEIPDNAVQFYREWFRAHPTLAPPPIPGFTTEQLDSAAALARGVTYYRFVDPPWIANGRTAGPCTNGECPSLQTDRGPVAMRCNARGICQETAPPAHSGAHYFYSVTATDHKLEAGPGNTLVPAGPGLAGDPSSSFVYLNPPTRALQPEAATEDAIYVVPNPATPETMQPWKLEPTNNDPTGTKIEFHHLPEATGKVSIFTLAGDLVKELVFDGTNGNGSLAWDLVSRNGQDVTSGVYLYAVEADDPRFRRFVGKFVVVR